VEQYQQKTPNDFSRKSKKYRTKYLDELKNLYGVATDGNHTTDSTDRGSRPSEASCLDGKTGD
jgi:hypothetical protein